MKDKLNDTMNRLDRAFALLSEIFVHKGDVDLMSMAKREMKAAYDVLEYVRDGLAKQEETDGQTDRG